MSAWRGGIAGSWLLAGIAATCVATMLGILGYTFARGAGAFWPERVARLTLSDGSTLVGGVMASEPGYLILRSGSPPAAAGAYRRIADGEVVAREQPLDAWLHEDADGKVLYGVGDAPPGDAGATIRPNALGFFGRSMLALQRVGAFLGPAHGEGRRSDGVLPALVGTVTLVLLMSVFAMPLGIATAVYLHRREGIAARSVRAAIDILAGVPSIVYGVLGLGLFVHGIGAGIDRLLYADRLPVPTFGSGGLLWASLTLALLTVPVVVVSVEQGLARIPRALVAGSLALGATREETLWHLQLPAVRPAMLTGLILAIARAAGSVAPLMLVGVVKLAPTLPLDATLPYLHPSRQFMHLGYVVYDSALASPDAASGVPRAYACAALLVVVVLVLNLSAILLRNRLRDRYRALEG